MTTLITQGRIEAYKAAYHACHGTFPIIRHNGAWLSINDNFTSFRSSDLPIMTLRLIEMTVRKRQNEIERKAIQQTAEKIPKWREIPEETILLFMNKLYEQCDHSLYKMERCMLNLACNNEQTDGFRSCNEEDCSIVYEINKERETLEEDIDGLLGELDDKKIENKRLKKSIDSLYIKLSELEEKNKYLKTNSVFFSMEDFDPVPTDYVCEDDEIPF